jgi:ribosomal protein S18 acetylase RimI-like enzyme
MTDPRRSAAGRHRPTAGGVVFRRLSSDAERAVADRLLAASGLPVTVPAGSGGAAFGLWDLAAVDRTSLVGVAVTGPAAGPASVVLTAVAVHTSRRRAGFGRRLVREVADALRAEGAGWLIAAPPAGDVRAQRLLRAAGFVPMPPVPGSPTRWLHLEL